MIGRLHGILLEKHPPYLLVDASGVGYELQVSMMTFYNLPEIGKFITLYTHFVVREDAQLLFGFLQKREREMFRALIKVNGVGPKLALTILSSIDPDGFVRCVMNDNTNDLIRLPGIGKKTAERLIVEMRDRLSDWQRSDRGEKEGRTASTTAETTAVQDAVSALVALGYKWGDANRVMSKLKTDNMTSEEIIRLALQEV